MLKRCFRDMLCPATDAARGHHYCLQTQFSNLLQNKGRLFNPIGLKIAKTLWSFGCSESKRVKMVICGKYINLNKITKI